MRAKAAGPFHLTSEEGVVGSGSPMLLCRPQNPQPSERGSRTVDMKVALTGKCLDDVGQIGLAQA